LSDLFEGRRDKINSAGPADCRIERIGAAPVTRLFREQRKLMAAAIALFTSASVAYVGYWYEPRVKRPFKNGRGVMRLPG